VCHNQVQRVSLAPLGYKSSLVLVGAQFVRARARYVAVVRIDPPREPYAYYAFGFMDELETSNWLRDCSENTN
jgi:hypothetical protein